MEGGGVKLRVGKSDGGGERWGEDVVCWRVERK